MAIYSQIANKPASPVFCILHKARNSALPHTANMDQEKNGGVNHLRAWREFRRLSREQLAAAIDPPTTGPVIWHLEEGERGLSAKWLRRLAPALGTTPGHLLDHDPKDLNTDILDIWAKADATQQAQIYQLADTVLHFSAAVAGDPADHLQGLIDAQRKKSKSR
jgi:transcriptional regulator with XRE-family HTH domain